MNDIPTRLCYKCGNVFPATEEHFFPSTLKDNSHNVCRKCHGIENKVRLKRQKEEIDTIAQLIDTGSIAAYTKLTTIAKTLGWSVEKVWHDVCKKNVSVFKRPYGTGTSFVLRNEDAEAYIASASNGHNETNASAMSVTIPIPQETKTEPIFLGTPNQCGACDFVTEDILGDIDKITRERNGYLCQRCHKLIQTVRQHRSRTRKLLAYLEKVDLSRVQ